MAKSWGQVSTYGDVVVLDTPFTIDGLTFVSHRIFVATGGNIVWKNNQGNLQYTASVPNNTFLEIGAQEIVTSGSVNGVNRTTSASGMSWLATNTLFNSP